MARNDFYNIEIPDEINERATKLCNFLSDFLYSDNKLYIESDIYVNFEEDFLYKIQIFNKNVPINAVGEIKEINDDSFESIKVFNGVVKTPRILMAKINKNSYRSESEYSIHKFNYLFINMFFTFLKEIKKTGQLSYEFFTNEKTPTNVDIHMSFKKENEYNTICISVNKEQFYCDMYWRGVMLEIFEEEFSCFDKDDFITAPINEILEQLKHIYY